jgi:DNA transformation protein and related proteins
VKRPDEFEHYVVEDVLGEIPYITSRTMFSGYGIYQRGVIFALIAEGELYFKVDEKTKGEYKERGSRPLSCDMPGGKKPMLSYWLLPEEVMENREEVARWVADAVATSKRAKRAKKSR